MFKCHGCGLYFFVEPARFGFKVREVPPESAYDAEAAWVQHRKRMDSDAQIKAWDDARRAEAAAAYKAKVERVRSERTPAGKTASHVPDATDVL